MGIQFINQNEKSEIVKKKSWIKLDEIKTGTRRHFSRDLMTGTLCILFTHILFTNAIYVETIRYMIPRIQTKKKLNFSQ